LRLGGRRRFVRGREICRREFKQLVRGLLAGGELVGVGVGRLLHVKRRQVEHRDNLLGSLERGVEIFGKQLRGRVHYFRRLVGAVVGRDVAKRPVIFEIGLGILLRPGIEVLQLLGRVGVVFDDLVVQVVFGPILGLLLGLGRLSRLRTGILGRHRHQERRAYRYSHRACRSSHEFVHGQKPFRNWIEHLVPPAGFRCIWNLLGRTRRANGLRPPMGTCGV